MITLHVRMGRAGRLFRRDRTLHAHWHEDLGRRWSPSLPPSSSLRPPLLCSSSLPNSSFPPSRSRSGVWWRSSWHVGSESRSAVLSAYASVLRLCPISRRLCPISLRLRPISLSLCHIGLCICPIIFASALSIYLRPFHISLGILVCVASRPTRCARCGDRGYGCTKERRVCLYHVTESMFVPRDGECACTSMPRFVPRDRECLYQGHESHITSIVDYELMSASPY